ncbi:aspartate carbamoyltransferase [Candidatus Pacearchaeota archaeon]|nr:aspartate carbamoyltransferase [Candidatus Pacearchaeota archaeon]
MADSGIITKQDFLGRDVVSIDDFSTSEIDYILDHAEKVQKWPQEFEGSMQGKQMMPMFFENSTRTATSFQVAMHNLSGSVVDLDLERSSIKKGETLRDTIKMINGYKPDVIVIRHSKDGSARFVADISPIPVMNAGDGKNQHPTQTLLDLYTIKEIKGTLDNVKIAIAGDLKYGRTPHSLALALARYEGCDMSFVSPESLSMPKDLLARLDKQNIMYTESGLNDLEEVINNCDMVYMTRVQRERFPEGPEGEHEYDRVASEYCLKESMLENVGARFKILHPLPKVFEIEDSVDDTDYAYYFRQAENGVYIRMALLDLVLGGYDD